MNYHSFGEWLLYPEGWQIGTPSADDPIYFALAGNLDDPAIEGFNPGLSSDVLYVTNGETTDYAHTQQDTLAWTPELGEGCAAASSSSRTTRRSYRPSSSGTSRSLSVAKSAVDPDDPVSSWASRRSPST